MQISRNTFPSTADTRQSLTEQHIPSPQAPKQTERLFLNRRLAALARAKLPPRRQINAMPTPINRVNSSRMIFSVMLAAMESSEYATALKGL